MIEIKRDPISGILDVYKDGVKVGQVISYGDGYDVKQREDVMDEKE